MSQIQQILNYVKNINERLNLWSANAKKTEELPVMETMDPEGLLIVSELVDGIWTSKQLEIKKIIDGIALSGQDNKVREVLLGTITADHDLSYLLDNNGITVTENEIVVLTALTNVNSTLIQKQYLWKLGKGTYNPIGSANSNTKLIELQPRFISEITAEELTSSPSAIVYDFGVITDTVLNVINTNYPAYNYTDDEKIYYIRATKDSVNLLYNFIGINRTYGTSGNQMTDADLVLVYSSANTGITELLNNKLDKDGYTGSAKTLDNRIELLESLPLSSTIVSETGFSLSDQSLTINANWNWILQNQNYTNPLDIVISIPLSAAGKKRIEYVVPNNANGFDRVSGPETTGIATAPTLSNKGMYVTFYTVTDSLIEEAASPNVGNIPSLQEVTDVNARTTNPISIRNKNGLNGISIHGFAVSMWKWVNGVSIYSNIRIDNITETYEIQLPNKLGGAEQTLAMVSDLEPYEKILQVDSKDAAKLIEAKTYADGLITQLINGAPADGNTLKELNDKILAVQAIIGGSTADGDAIVNTVSELLAVFATFPEAVDLVTLLAGKVNTTDVYNALDCIVAGKVLDARQGKVLNDLITTLRADVTANTTAIGLRELSSNKSQDIETDKASTTKFGSVKAFYDWCVGRFQPKLTAGTNVTIDNTNPLAPVINATGSGVADPSQITITTTVSITTDTVGNLGETQKEKNVIIDNGVNAINITVNGGSDFLVSYVKHGTGAITFVQGTGRTLALVDATAVFNGIVGSTATISSIGTKDYLRISNAT